MPPDYEHPRENHHKCVGQSLTKSICRWRQWESLISVGLSSSEKWVTKVFLILLKFWENFQTYSCIHQEFILYGKKICWEYLLHYITQLSAKVSSGCATILTAWPVFGLLRLLAVKIFSSIRSQNPKNSYKPGVEKQLGTKKQIINRSGQFPHNLFKEIFLHKPNQEERKQDLICIIFSGFPDASFFCIQ